MGVCVSIIIIYYAHPPSHTHLSVRLLIECLLVLLDVALVSSNVVGNPLKRITPLTVFAWKGKMIAHATGKSSHKHKLWPGLHLGGGGVIRPPPWLVTRVLAINFTIF